MKKYQMLIGVAGFIIANSALAATCDFTFENSAGDTITTIELQSITEADVYKLTQNQAATQAFESDFSLSFENCADTLTISITFTETAQTGAAAGLELKIFDSGIVQDGTGIATLVLSGATSATRPFSINYLKTAANNVNIIPGSLSRSFDFVVEYL